MVAVVVSLGRLGIEPDRLVVIGDGAVEIAFGVVCGTTGGVGEGELGIKLDRLVVVGDGAVEIALGVVCGATVVVGEAARRGISSATSMRR